MALSQAQIESELNGLGHYLVEADAIAAWAAAYKNYFANAISNGIPVVVPALATAEAAMAGAMTGLSTAAPAALQAGITAFWAALVAAPITYFPPAILIVPPGGLATLATGLAAAFNTNISTSASKAVAATNVAAVIHPATLTGTATFPGAPPIVAPIL